MQKYFRLPILVMFLATCGDMLADPIELQLQRRDAEKGTVTSSLETVDPSRVGIVIVDMWNWHWCKTSSMRVAALVPRMRHVIDTARELGMTIFWCPSDVVDNYVGTLQHEATARVEKVPLPALIDLDCPPAPDGGGCT